MYKGLCMILAIVLLALTQGCESTQIKIERAEPVSRDFIIGHTEFTVYGSFRDAEYTMLTRDGLDNALAVCAKYVQGRWIERVRDCDDFALYLRYGLHNELSYLGYNPAIAEVSYIVDGQGGHRIIAVYTYEGWLFVEPRAYKVGGFYYPAVVQLSPTEKASIHFRHGFIM